MKNLFSLLFVALLSTTAFSQTTWNADPMHSKVTFGITHTGISEVTGLFQKFEASAISSKADFSDAVFELTVDVASINTEVEKRDNHLKSADFFEVATYPTMTYKSTSIKKVSTNKYQLTGNLTLRGVTKLVTMNLWYRGTIENPQSKASISGFQLTGTIKRSEFNIGTKFAPPMLSDEVQIKADGEFIKK
ncbi:MAG: YceI family protein [Sphingobacteriaceae bacterium]